MATTRSSRFSFRFSLHKKSSRKEKVRISGPRLEYSSSEFLCFSPSNFSHFTDLSASSLSQLSSKKTTESNVKTLQSFDLETEPLSPTRKEVVAPQTAPKLKGVPTPQESDCSLGSSTSTKVEEIEYTPHTPIRVPASTGKASPTLSTSSCAPVPEEIESLTRKKDMSLPKCVVSLKCELDTVLPLQIRSASAPLAHPSPYGRYGSAGLKPVIPQEKPVDRVQKIVQECKRLNKLVEKLSVEASSAHSETLEAQKKCLEYSDALKRLGNTRLAELRERDHRIKLLEQLLTKCSNPQRTDPEHQELSGAPIRGLRFSVLPIR